MVSVTSNAQLELLDLPITKGADENLADNNTANLEVLNGSNPSLIAYLVGLPASLPDLLEKRSQVTNREEDVTMRTFSGV